MTFKLIISLLSILILSLDAKEEFLNVSRTNMNGEISVLLPGQSFLLYFYVAGSPRPKISCTKDGLSLAIPSVFEKKYTYNVILHFLQITYNHTALYSCKAENKVGKLNRNITVYVVRDIQRKIRPPKINLESVVNVKFMSKLTIECMGEEEIEWIWPDKSFFRREREHNNYRRYIADKGIYLLRIEIQFVHVGFIGHYICCYTRRDCNLSENKASTYISLKDIEFIMDSEVIRERGSKSFLPPVYRCIRRAVLCIPSNYEINVTLWKNSEPIPLNSGISFETTRGFIFNEETPNFDGNYTCKEGKYSEIETPITKFDVDPDILLYATDENPFEHNDVSIVCNACSYHYSKFHWSWIGNDQNQEIKIEDENNLGIIITEIRKDHEIESRLQIDNIKLNSSGIYKCLVYSETDISKNQRKTLLIQVKVIQKPVVNIIPSGTSVVSFGKRTQLHCNAIGDPPPRINWIKDGEPLLQSNDVEINGSYVIIKQFSKNYAGNYECVAKVGRYTATSTAVLKINSKIGASLISAIVVPLILLLIFVAGIIFQRRKILKKRDEQWMDIISELFSKREAAVLLNSSIPLQEQTDSLPYDPNWEFPADRLKTGKTLGVGAFGKVVEAEAIGIKRDEDITTVAVKMMKDRRDILQLKLLAAELKILIYIGNHINIVNLLGAVTKNISSGELMVIIEYCCFGNIRQYLIRKQNQFINQVDPETDTVDISICSIEDSIRIKKMDTFSTHYQKFVWNNQTQSVDSDISFSPNTSCIRATNEDGVFHDDSNSMKSKNVCAKEELSKSNLMENDFVTTSHLISFAYQTSRGMEYLASRKLIHRDLSARNVLLAEGNVVKICDFGLTRNAYDYADLFKKSNDPLPIKWMAIESLREKVFTSKSDVWSFGIYLWELFSLGAHPYPGIEVNPDFYKMLKNGYRMSKPDYAPRNIYDIMLNCWNSEPADRPTFSKLVELFNNLLEKCVKRHYIRLDMIQLEEENKCQPTTETSEDDDHLL